MFCISIARSDRTQPIRRTYLRAKPQTAPVHDALERLRAAMRQHMPLQPPSRARLPTMHLTAGPLARKRSRLRVHVLRLQMIEQLATAIVALRAIVPVAHADQPTVALAHARTARRSGGRKPNRLRLRQNRTLGARCRRWRLQQQMQIGGCATPEAGRRSRAGVARFEQLDALEHVTFGRRKRRGNANDDRSARLLEMWRRCWRCGRWSARTEATGRQLEGRWRLGGCRCVEGVESDDNVGQKFAGRVSGDDRRLSRHRHRHWHDCWALRSLWAGGRVQNRCKRWHLAGRHRRRGGKFAHVWFGVQMRCRCDRNGALGLLLLLSLLLLLLLSDDGGGGGGLTVNERLRYAQRWRCAAADERRRR